MPQAMNPYVPGQPADPGSFAGRLELIRRVEVGIEEALKLRRSSALLLQGYRGSGKTSAIRKIQALAHEKLPGALTAEIQLRAQSSEEHLLESIVKDVKRQLAARRGAGERVKNWIERLNSVTIAGSGFTLGAKGGPATAQGLTLWKSCVDALEGAPLLVVCIDDAELLDTSGIGALKTIAESHSEVPVILVVAGGVELWDSLTRKDTSPIARIFSGAMFDIGEFSPSETRDALEAPIAKIKGSGRWTSEGASEVQALSHGYPYLVQCVAAAAYGDGISIDAKQVRKTLPAALKAGSSWLERESIELSDEDVRAFVKIASCGRPILRSSEIMNLGVQGPYIARLARLKVLRKVSRGRYELRKAPAIAYYHALRRGLTV